MLHGDGQWYAVACRNRLASQVCFPAHGAVQGALLSSKVKELSSYWPSGSSKSLLARWAEKVMGELGPDRSLIEQLETRMRDPP